MHFSRFVLLLLFIVACWLPGVEVRAEGLESWEVLPTICLDPGHPSFEGDKLFEGILNRKVALLLERQLLDAGFDVFVTVRDIPAEELFSPGFDNESEEQQSRLTVASLETRRDMCLASGAQIVVSIHHNFSFDPTMNHAAVLYGGNDAASRHLAEFTAERFSQVMRVTRVRYARDTALLGLALTMLEPRGYIGILTEASFYSHPPERVRLNRNTYLMKEAKAIFGALRRFIITSKQRTTL